MEFIKRKFLCVFVKSFFDSSYVNRVIRNQGNVSEALVNAVKTLFAYNKLAESYFN